MKMQSQEEKDVLAYFIKKTAMPLFKSGLKLNDRELESVVFVVAMILYCEKNLEGLCLHIMNKQSMIANAISKEISGHIFEELTFSSKINILEKTLKKIQML